MASRRVARSAASGEFVSPEEAERHPETTVIETIDTSNADELQHVLYKLDVVRTLAERGLTGIDRTGQLSTTQQALVDVIAVLDVSRGVPPVASTPVPPMPPLE